jgi:hypothetical protein
LLSRIVFKSKDQELITTRAILGLEYLEGDRS